MADTMMYDRNGPSSVYGALQRTPARSTANSRDCLTPPVGSTDGDGSARRDGVKKRTFWNWRKGRKAGQSANEVAVVPADNSTEGETSGQQVSVEVHLNQETLVSEPDGDGSGKRDEVKKKKKRFWKWRKGREATEVAVVPADNSTEGETSGQQVSVEVHLNQETLVSEPDGDGSGKRDEVKKKKKRFWKWRKGREATEVAVVPADNSTEGK
ncbi:hypothetical protein IRJ41_002859 [Triplophysa rosa]|uniref:Uncharacterized protein n=1 Tax=Triplophysa rosa TaxID=992332 RepID=A0A9W7WSC8_TRIRA|nr:hypothetical protein IRJ41_002859 [Triplophysa rosa]